MSISITHVIPVYRCPSHGVIQHVWDDDGSKICPINLSDDYGRITDDLCQQECAGPIDVRLTP